MSENPSDWRPDRSWIVGRLADCIDQALAKSEETRLIIAPLAGRAQFRWYNELSFDGILKDAAALPPHNAREPADFLVRREEQK